jgi:hypothetical protein
MRSTPARLLRQNQLLVERYAVHKINKVEYPLPQNAVTVKLTNSWWFGPVRLDPVAPEPRQPTADDPGPMNLSVREQRFHAPFHGGSRSSRNQIARLIAETVLSA